MGVSRIVGRAGERVGRGQELVSGGEGREGGRDARRVDGGMNMYAYVCMYMYVYVRVPKTDQT